MIWTIPLLGLGYIDTEFFIEFSSMFVVPALMNIANMKALAKQKAVALTQGEKLEIVGNYGIVGTGVSLGVLGVAISILRQLKKIWEASTQRKSEGCGCATD